MKLGWSLLLALVCVAIIACNSGELPQDDKGREDFIAFQEKFYTDSLFQLKRIEFPLAGKDPKGENEQFYWDTDNWVQLKSVEESPQVRLLPIVDMGTWMRERIVLQDRFYIEKQFTLIDNKWYLTQYTGVTTAN